LYLPLFVLILLCDYFSITAILGTAPLLLHKMALIVMEMNLVHPTRRLSCIISLEEGYFSGLQQEQDTDAQHGPSVGV
jgi:hypothetical protein